MIDIQKVTSDERGLIVDAVCPIMCAVEDAKDLLSDIEGEYFEVRDIKLDQNDVERIALVVRVVGNMLYNACTAFGLLTGVDSFGNPNTPVNRWSRFPAPSEWMNLPTNFVKKNAT